MPIIELKYTFDNEDELRAHLGGETRTVTTAPSDDSADDNRSDADTDSDGMPYDPEIHTDTRAVNADGTWKARRGMADKAKHARAAFKAGGGTEEAPADLPGTETKATDAAPSLPGAAALPSDAPEPISWDRMVEKITGMMGRGKLGNNAVQSLYSKHGGADPVATLSSNETARAAMFADLCAIEPELS